MKKLYLILLSAFILTNAAGQSLIRPQQIISTTLPSAANSAWIDPTQVPYNAACVNTTTTGSGSSSVTPTLLTVASASGWRVGMGIAIAGAGTAGAELLTKVNAISGTVFTLNTSIITTVSGVTVNHDDTVALTAAVQSGFNVQLPSGKCNVNGGTTTTGIVFNQPNIFQGMGFADDLQGTLAIGTSATYIINRSTTGTTLDLSTQDLVNYNQLRNFTIQQATGVAPTAGYAIRLGNAANTKSIHDVYISNVSIFRTFGGVTINGHVNASTLEGMDIRVKGGAGSTAINYANASTAGGNFIRNNTLTSLTTGGRTVTITASDTDTWINNYITGGTNALYISNDVGTVNNLIFTGGNIENGDGTNPMVLMQSTAVGNVSKITFTGGEFGVNAGSGGGIAINQHVGTVSIIGNLFQSIAGNAIAIASDGGLYTIVGNNCTSVGTGVRLSSTGPPANVNILGNPGCTVTDGGTNSSFTWIDGAHVSIGTLSQADVFTYNGHIIALGTVPVMGSCGTSPSITGNDDAFTVTVGTGGSATSCAITFATAATTNAPVCTVASDSDAALKIATTTTAVTVSQTLALTASSKLQVQCRRWL